MHCITCALKNKVGKPLLFKQTLRSRFTCLAYPHFSFHAKKKGLSFVVQSPASRLQSRAWSFACFGRFAWRTKKKRETAGSVDFYRNFQVNFSCSLVRLPRLNQERKKKVRSVYRLVKRQKKRLFRGALAGQYLFWAYNPLSRCSSQMGRSCTGSRGDMFVVSTSKPVEKLRKNGLFWSR